jgi:dTMP kinase
MSRNGTFVAIEGLDGSGKTSVVEELERELDVVTTSEPSEFWTGEQLRKALRSDTDAFTDFFLFMSDRHIHIEQLIKPAVEDGELVVSDRFADSTRAYQNYQLADEFRSGPHCWKWIEDVMEPWSYPPDLVVYLDISVETALERCDGEEKYEQRGMLEAVRGNYARVLASNPNPQQTTYERVDAEQELESVKDEVIEIVDEYTDE